ncbi:MAG: EboA domain-containing protein [Rhodospirillales bacterium]|nr:EboA domain-containing protein [Rhodospirillales bacterium]
MVEIRPSSIAAILEGWVVRQVPADAGTWLAQTRRRLAATATDRDLFLAMALVPRKTGRFRLQLSAEEVEHARSLVAGWRPDLLSTDEAARLSLLLAAEGGALADRLDRLCTAADVGELVAYYRGLPLYPEPVRHLRRAEEGVRSNMRSVFEAVAHRNPYPAAHFPESAWNQMVLKAIFIGSSLDAIEGLDDRCNPALTRMLCDYAHERWAARRPVSLELWRCVGPFADDLALGDIERLIRQGGELGLQAAALALAGCPHPRAEELWHTLPTNARQGSWAELAGR